MPPERRQPLLEVAGVTAGYRRLQVLWGVDLAVHEHETVVLLGANGAGKTTLLKAIMRLVDSWAGRIAFAGEDITGCAPTSGCGAASSSCRRPRAFPA